MTVQRQKRQPLWVAVTPSGVLSVIAAALFIWGLPLFWKAINVRSESHNFLVSSCVPITDKDGNTCRP